MKSIFLIIQLRYSEKLPNGHTSFKKSTFIASITRVSLDHFPTGSYNIVYPASMGADVGVTDPFYGDKVLIEVFDVFMLVASQACLRGARME